ncbi:hypothetical protein VP01_2126g2 [Puccinia sorghi]|uniref:Uncharacterized protein n=1 Tax=Puccinia sorghi TaxID=27349 RepID=A0A0L6VAI7_9BASI|nr:hypothetical protein VP01_2126g2 [Puccinia sorghi]
MTSFLLQASHETLPPSMARFHQYTHNPSHEGLQSVFGLQHLLLSCLKPKNNRQRQDLNLRGKIPIDSSHECDVHQVAKAHIAQFRSSMSVNIRRKTFKMLFYGYVLLSFINFILCGLSLNFLINTYLVQVLSTHLEFIDMACDIKYSIQGDRCVISGPLEYPLACTTTYLQITWNLKLLSEIHPPETSHNSQDHNTTPTQSLTSPLARYITHPSRDMAHQQRHTSESARKRKKKQAKPLHTKMKTNAASLPVQNTPAPLHFMSLFEISTLQRKETKTSNKYIETSITKKRKITGAARGLRSTQFIPNPSSSPSSTLWNYSEGSRAWRGNRQLHY